MTNRTLEALRRLAERPGTPAEGEAARAALARIERRTSGLTGFASFEQYLRDKDAMAFVERLRAEFPPPKSWGECYSPRRKRKRSVRERPNGPSETGR